MIGNQINKGRVATEETRQTLSRAGRGKKKSPEHIAKVAESLRGRKPSEQCREAASESGKRRMLGNQINKGKKWVNKDGKNKLVLADQLQSHLDSGWYAGMDY